MEIRNEKVIDSSEFDGLVQKTYGKPYCFQQQEGCKDRGRHHFSVPHDYPEDEDMHDSIPEVVNGQDMGVKFKVWLERDPNKKLLNLEDQEAWSLDLFWERNFYPDFGTLVNDLHAKGLIEKGEYVIDIDW